MQRMSYDIGLCVDKRHGLKQDEIRNYLIEAETPDPTLNFPATLEANQIRKFQYDRLERFKWLTYSKAKNGAFCKYCVLFVLVYGGSSSSQHLKTVVTVPLTRYKKALEDINRHLTEFEKAQTALEALRVIKSKEFNHFFPNVAILLQLFSTIPVTSATAEQTFSMLKRLKSYLGVNMPEPRLNGLALGNVHKEIEITTEEVVKTFCQVKPRRHATLNWADGDC